MSIDTHGFGFLRHSPVSKLFLCYLPCPVLTPKVTKLASRGDLSIMLSTSYTRYQTCLLTVILWQIYPQLPDHDDVFHAATGKPVHAVGGVVERQLIGRGATLTEQERQPRPQPVRAPEDPQLCIAAFVIQISFEFLGKEVLIMCPPLLPSLSTLI